MSGFRYFLRGLPVLNIDKNEPRPHALATRLDKNKTERKVCRQMPLQKETLRSCSSDAHAGSGLMIGQNTM